MLALHQLVATWGETRNSQLADRIVRLGKLLSEELPPVEDGGTGDAGDWLVLASRGRLVDVERLMASFDDGTSRVIAARLDRMRDRLPDPRTTEAVLAFARALPFSSSLARRVWTAWFRFARHLADPRMAAGLTQMVEDARARLHTEDPPRWLEFEHFLINRLEPLLDSLPVSRPVDGIPALDESLDAFSKSTPPPVERLLLETPSLSADLFAQILSTPEEGLIAVWADALSEAEDPRGEFVTIQLTRETRPLKKREREQERRLFKRHRNRWLGPLDAVVESATARFRRGLLDAARVRVESDAQRALLDRPEWRSVRALQSTTTHLRSEVTSLVERVGVRMVRDDDPEVRGPPGFALQDVKPPSWTQFTELARSESPLGIRAMCTALPGTPTGAHERALHGLRGLPDLEELHLVDTAHWYRRNPNECGMARLGALAHSDVLRSIRRLVIDGVSPVAQAPDALWWRDHRPEELVLIGSGPWIRSYRFDADGVHATVSKPGSSSFVPSGSTAGLGTLRRTLPAYLGPPEQLASITVRSCRLPPRELDVFREVLQGCPEVNLPPERRTRRNAP